VNETTICRLEPEASELAAPVQPAVLTREQAAEYLAVPRGTLDVWRSRGKGPAFVRLGRSVRYRVATLDAYLLEREQGGSAA
jgi:excisionase family DNA binding protein